MRDVAGRPALGPLTVFPSAMTEPGDPARAIAVAWVLSFVGSMALSAIVQLLSPNLATPQFPQLSPALLLFLVVVLVPLIETLIMATVLEVLLRLRVPPPLAILVSAAGWAIAHSLQAAAWGLVIWWPFLIFSTLYVVWRQSGYTAAIAVPAAAHVLQNLIPGLLIAFGPQA